MHPEPAAGADAAVLVDDDAFEYDVRADAKPGAPVVGLRLFVRVGAE